MPPLQFRLILTNTRALAIPGAIPLSPGYALIIPKRALQQDPVEDYESGQADEAAGPGMNYQFANEAVSFAEVIWHRSSPWSYCRWSDQIIIEN